MPNLDGGAFGTGTRRQALVLSLLPLAGFLAACGGGGGGGATGLMSPDPLIVLAATPTNGQETLTDLSDPGLGGTWSIRFSVLPRSKDILDPTNIIQGVTPNVQILNQGFQRVAGTPSLDPSTGAFTFTPAGGTLPNAQYTLTMSKFITTLAGRPLGLGIDDFSTSFTVGPDTYPPVVRNTTPVANQADTPLFNPIVITFNESLDPASVVLNQTVFIEDGGTNPPTAQGGVLSLKRDGFDMVFTPDPCVGLAPSTTIVVRLRGVGNTSYVRDRIGNGLVGDPTNGNQYAFQFNTKGTKRLPNPAIVYPPGTPKLGPIGRMAYASTGNTTYAFDMTPVLADFQTNFTVNPSLTVQVLTNNRTWRLVAGVWVQTAPFGGDWEAKLGQAGEAILDWRINLTTSHTYIYQIDAAREAIAIINTGTGKVEGHLNGTGTPRGIGISGPGSTGLSPVLFISNYGQGTVTSIPIGTIVPGNPICTAVKELQDDTSKRKYLLTGRNPSGLACEYLGVPLACVVNQGDNDIQMFDPATLQPPDRLGIGTLTQHYPVGENPIDIAWTPYFPGLGIFCYVVNQGGLVNPHGSVSFWFNSSTSGPFAATTGAILGTLEEGLDIPGRPTADPASGVGSCYIPNTASDDVVRIDISIQGGSIFASFQPNVGEARFVGENPQRMTWTGPIGLEMAFVALAGSGQLAVYERRSSDGSPALFNLPGVREVFSQWDQ